MMRKFVAILALFAVVSVFVAGQAHAGWFEEVGTASMRASSPKYFDTQKGGAFSLGNFSARTPTKTTYFAHFTAPSYNAGCGGIDAIFGGFDFLGVDQIIKSFQRIMQAAPAFAFKLALEQLCAPCGQVIQTLQALADKLNGFGLDECRMSSFFADKAVKWADKKLNDEAFWGEGLEDNYFDRLLADTRDINNVNDWVESLFVDENDSGSTAEAAALIKQGSMWNQIAIGIKERTGHADADVWNNGSSESSFTYLVRALFGDVLCISAATKAKPDKGVDIKSIAPGGCAPISRVETMTPRKILSALLSTDGISGVGADGETIKYVGASDAASFIAANLRGKAYHEAALSQIKAGISNNLDDVFPLVDLDSSTVKNIAFGLESEKHINSIVTAMLTGGNIDSSDVTFVNEQSLPLYRMLNTYALYGTLATDAETLKAVGAVSSAYHFLEEMLNIASKEAYKHFAKVKLFEGPEVEASEGYKSDRILEIMKVIGNIRDYQKELDYAYDEALKTLTDKMILMTQYRMLDEKARQVAKRQLLTSRLN